MLEPRQTLGTTITISAPSANLQCEADNKTSSLYSQLNPERSPLKPSPLLGRDISVVDRVLEHFRSSNKPFAIGVSRGFDFPKNDFVQL
jgi:hypothetical protein